jgi:hypothetical protein
MRIKVRGGTMTHGGETLCSTCSRSTIIRGRKLDEEIVDCHIIGLGHRRITFRVTSCSAYTDARLPSMYQLLENAWVLREPSKRRPAGFVHGKDLRAEEMADLMTGGDLEADE